MEKLLLDDDFGDLFAEFNKADKGEAEQLDPEMEASQKRYQEIINKHKNTLEELKNAERIGTLD